MSEEKYTEDLIAENEKLRQSMNLADVGWWEIDTESGNFIISDYIKELLYLNTNVLSDEECMKMVRDDYKERIIEEFMNMMPGSTSEMTFPIKTEYGDVWVVSRFKAEDYKKVSRLYGIFRHIEDPEKTDLSTVTLQKVNNLIYQQDSISRTLQSLLHDADMTAVVNSILGDLLHQFNAQRAYMMECNHIKRTQDCVYEVCSRDELREIDNLKDIPFDFVKWWMDHLFADKPVIISSLDDIPPEGENVRMILEPQNIKSLMVVPLMINGYLWGYAGIDIVDYHRTWSNEDYRWFSSMINIVGICMELRRSELKAQNLDKLKSIFLANMSHEIRTPLNAIIGFSRLIADSDSKEERAEYLSIVQDNNELLLQLISDILDLSKIEAGTLDFSREKVDLYTLCKEIQLSYMVKDKRGNNLVFDLDSPRYYLNADRLRVIQIITNFMNNAIKFTDKGVVTLSYKLEGSNYVKISVTDTGIGIPEDQKEMVFDRFVKLNNYKQGTGLGLAICRSIVEHMGGSIGVDSEVGKGSTFWFTLPYGEYK